jgi:hypothetical protein
MFNFVIFVIFKNLPSLFKETTFTLVNRTKLLHGLAYSSQPLDSAKVRRDVKAI